MKSKFKLWAFLPIVILILVTGVLAIIVNAIVDHNQIPPIGVMVFLLLFVFVFIWILFGELRTKVVVAEIENDVITITNYLGIGHKKTYMLSQFEGYETSVLPSRYDKYEYLYLIENGRKCIKLSEYYHKNYFDMKFYISKSVRNMGQKKFSYITELKEIFI